MQLRFLFLLLAVASVAVLSAQAQDADFIAIWANMVRNEESYDRLEAMASSGVHSSSNIDKLQREAIHQLFAILKATVPISAHPSPEELKVLSRNFAKAMTNLSRAAHEDDSLKTFSKYIFKVASNTALLTTNSTHPEYPSPSKFANALMLLPNTTGGVYDIFKIASTVRCVVDKAKLLPKSEKSLHTRDMDVQNKIMEECGMKSGYNAMIGTFFVVEIAERFSSERNTEVFVNDFSTLMEALKNPKSYESAEAFASNIQKSRNLKAIVQLMNEARRCVYQIPDFPIDAIKEVRASMYNIVKKTFASVEDPTGDVMLEDYSRITSNIDPLRAAFRNMSNRGGREFTENLWKCILPASDCEKVEKLTPVLNGNEEEEAKMLEQVANISETFHSIFVIFYEHLRALRNRVGVTDEVNSFITTVLTKWREFALADGTTDEGKVTQDRAFDVMRTSFIDLSNDSKRILSYRFPFRTTCVLGAIF